MCMMYVCMYVCPRTYVCVCVLGEGERVVTLVYSVFVHLCSIVDSVVVDNNFIDPTKFAKVFVLFQNLWIRQPG